MHYGIWVWKAGAAADRCIPAIARLEVRWMPPGPNDRSKAVDLAPGE